MKVKKSVISKITEVPLIFWVLTILIYIVPFLYDQEAGGRTELVWFVYIIPAFILSYYWGVWGGTVTAVISILTQTIWEFVLSQFERGEIYEENYIVLLTTSLISVGIALGIGLLANRLKRIQKIIVEKNLELQEKNKQLDDMSHMDELTGLWNRRGLIKIAQYWLNNNKEQQHFSVLFIDLDKFKPVNDTYGHQVGDKLLKEVANRLKNCLPANSVISRIGGDEFTVLIPKANESYSIHIVQKIKSALSKMFIIEGKEIFITPSTGISLSAIHGIDVESLLQKADIAMYSVKRKGRNGYSIFEPYMKELSESRLQRINQLRKALEREEFSLYYQPQLDVMTGQIVSVEALIRWHANGSIISPTEFIPLAEETGLILPIGQWVLETACKQMKVWQDGGIKAFSIAVNVSSHQFQQPDFIQSVQKVLNETKIEPDCLRLELTESVILGNEEVIISKLIKLKLLGVSLSIDDFGSGYSSLSYLKNFPIDEIKMDKSFIDEVPSNLKDRSLVQSIVNLGHSLNTAITAEGVENAEQLSFLKDAGCDKVQGYLISKPLSVTELEKLLQKHFNMYA